MKKYLFVFFLGIYAPFSYGQIPAQPGLVQNGDRITFIGNSITNNGLYHSYLYLYYLTRFPDMQADFFNCGVSGDVAKNVMDRLQSDVLSHHPTVATLSLGMNDVNRSLYFKGVASADTLQKREAALELYKKSIETLINDILASGSKLILLTPTVYDQTSTMTTPNNYGVNDALGRCREYVLEMAKKYTLPVVDFHPILDSINQSQQKINPLFTITTTDRVHPQAPGHLVMTYQWLKTFQMPKYVSSVCLDAKQRRVIDVKNGKADDLKVEHERIRWDLLEYALPFPKPSDVDPALEWVPFNASFNQEELKAINLPSGNYELKIDGTAVGSYSSTQLASGINLALNTQTPQYRQSSELLLQWEKRNAMIAKIRGIKFVEKMLNDRPDKAATDKDKLELAKALYTKMLTKGYVKDRFSDYLINKPKEHEFWQELEAMVKKLNEMNKPAKHRYALNAVN